MTWRTMLVLPMMLLLASRAWSAGLPEADARAIRELTKRYVEAALAGNWDAWASQLTADAVFLQPNGPAVEGRAAIRAWVVAFAGMASFTVTPEEIKGSDGLAWARGTYAFSMGPTARSQGSDNGKWLNTYEKQTDGSWRIKCHMWNSSQPLTQK